MSLLKKFGKITYIINKHPPMYNGIVVTQHWALVFIWIPKPYNRKVEYTRISKIYSTTMFRRMAKISITIVLTNTL